MASKESKHHEVKNNSNESSSNRLKALDAALGQIDKQFGKGSIMRMGEKDSMTIASIPTGALPLDIALGIGGLPRGRVIEIFGPESSGKSTLAMHVVAEAQRNGGICAYVDAEHALDPVYAKAIGVDIDNLLISQPDTGEQALEITDMLVRSGSLDVIVIDSVAVLECDSIGIVVDGPGFVIRNSTVDACGQLGMNVRGADGVLENNVVRNNNTRGFNKWWEAGGMKFVGNGGLKRG